MDITYDNRMGGEYICTLIYIFYVCMYVYAVNVFMKYVYFYEMIIVFKYFLNMATYNNNEKKRCTLT